MEKKYFSDEEKKAARREACRRSYQKHKKKKAEYGKQYYQDKKEDDEWMEKHRENIKSWREENPIKHRASNLVSAYSQCDRNAGRGKCTLTSKWIMDNIFPKPCHWCGEVGWEIMGCDRIDNALPHTPDNVNPCCEACNKKRGKKSYEEFKEALRAEETVL